MGLNFFKTLNWQDWVQISYPNDIPRVLDSEESNAKDGPIR